MTLLVKTVKDLVDHLAGHQQLTKCGRFQNEALQLFGMTAVAIEIIQEILVSDKIKRADDDIH